MSYNMKICSATFIVLLTITGSNAVKSADIDISNLTAAISGFETLPASNIVKSVASSFTTASITGTISAQTIDLYMTFSGTYDLAKLNVQIFTDSSNAPGTPVGGSAFSSVVSTGTNAGVYRFVNTSNPVLLNSNSNYWVVIKNSSSAGSVGTNANWVFTSSSTPVVGNNGSIWMNGSVFTGIGSWNVKSGSPFLFAVSSTVPEPSTYVLGVSSILILAYIKRYRRDSSEG
jgi:hypothetical protein